MSQSKKILMVMPALPFEQKGAEQMDRDQGIRQLIRLGYKVKVIAKLNEWQTPEYVKKAAQEYGVPVIGVPYIYSNKVLTTKDRIFKFLKRFQNPLYFDGAAFEYAEPGIQAVVLREVEEWKPDIMWFEYTYLWPLYHIARSRKIPIITRSINFEPDHFIEEDGMSLINRLKYAIKLIGEKKTLRMSDVVFSITPQEKSIYEELGARHVINLPLRGLPQYIPTIQEIRDRRPLNVFFMGSTYTVNHNKEALRIVVADIAPKIFKLDPDGYKFHIFGKKLPQEFNIFIRDNVQYDGFVENRDFLKDMDIALIPSLFGAGMQQKIFEPLSMGIPLLTSKRGIAGYPFIEGESVMFGADTEEFVRKIVMLKDRALRQKLSDKSKAIAGKLFSQEALDVAVNKGVEEAFEK